ncbi:hypothetical protein BO79DRAFT_47457 [Aspergillus costaricaensis CBS 115574]|uniref:Uncharacterized protein n=1 Tax=Aspergillus costaricaensis CBS 115574 TaxID=1448317 RepID=A0ACD1I4H6_9EURO|nr:hypothetical protein BO79DRAFT_47457 [Aspergillus costaricaensis CBS 115574]RAK85384.1 hypothetical protein BO79DRAFT_47457 [Aspergillus costaricaensis CBS 115574]
MDGGYTATSHLMARVHHGDICLLGPRLILLTCLVPLCFPVISADRKRERQVTDGKPKVVYFGHACCQGSGVHARGAADDLFASSNLQSCTPDLLLQGGSRSFDMHETRLVGRS